MVLLPSLLSCARIVFFGGMGFLFVCVLIMLYRLASS